MSSLSYTLVVSLLALLLFQTLCVGTRAVVSPPIQARQTSTPSFPADPPSCPICAQSYSSIDSCAAAAPVLANVSMIIFNPGAFIDVIQCACTDTFQAAYPQCVDCFTRTNQTEFLSTSADSLPGIISGIRSICAISSTLLGNASVANGEISSSVTNTAALPTDSSILANSAVGRLAIKNTLGSGIGIGSGRLVAGLALGFALCVA